MTQSPGNMKGAVSFFFPLSESAIWKNGVWYKKYQSFTKVLFQQPAIYIVSFHFLWLFDDVNLLKEFQKPESINIAFIFSSLFVCLFSVTRTKCLCIFFPLEIVQIWQNCGFAKQCCLPLFIILVSQWDFTTDLMRPGELKYIDCICHCWRTLTKLLSIHGPHTPRRKLCHCSRWCCCHHVCAASCRESSESAFGGSMSAQPGLASRVSSVWCSEDNEFIDDIICKFYLSV